MPFSTASISCSNIPLLIFEAKLISIPIIQPITASTAINAIMVYVINPLAATCGIWNKITKYAKTNSMIPDAKKAISLAHFAAWVNDHCKPSEIWRSKKDSSKLVFSSMSITMNNDENERPVI